MIPQVFQDMIRRGVFSHATLFTGGNSDAWVMVAQEVGSLLAVAPADTFYVAVPPKISELRQLLERVHWKPNQSAHVLVSFAQVDHWPPEIANAVLKTLEEPPPHVRFLLFAADDSSVLPTIRSRTARFRLSVAAGESSGDGVPSLEELVTLPLCQQLDQTGALAERLGVQPVLTSWLVSTKNLRMKQELLRWLNATADRPVNKRLLLDTIAVDYRFARGDHQHAF